MPHMPVSGLSGPDLYLKSSDTSWNWVKGDYSFSDTVKWTCSNPDIANTNLTSVNQTTKDETDLPGKIIYAAKTIHLKHQK